MEREVVFVNTFIDTVGYFLFIMAELAVLFIVISTIIALAFMYIPQEKLKSWMSGKGLWGNVMAVAFGAVTPFCACSTVPMTLGFLQVGSGAGIAIPELTILASIFKRKIIIAFVMIVFVMAVLVGLIFNMIL